MSNIAFWGIGAGVVALIAAGWRHIVGVARYFRNFVFVTVEVYDIAAVAMESYLVHNGRATRYSLRTITGWKEFVRPKNRRECVAAETIGKESKTFWFGRRPIRVSRTDPTNGKSDGWVISQPLRLTFIRGTFNVDALILAAIEFYNERDRSRGGARYDVRYLSGTAGKPATITTMAGGVETPSHIDHDLHRRLLRWTLADLGSMKSKGRALDSLALSAEEQKLVDYLRSFLDNREWFSDHGVPWKQGVLLYGIPGTGKTALTRALAEEFNLPIFQFDLATFFNDEFHSSWKDTLSETPCIALFEDIDTVFDGRETVRGELGFDRFLNCVDGAERSDGVITIITTNRIDTLDSAIGGRAGDQAPRPSRINHVVEMKPLDHAGRLQLAQRILSDWPWEWGRIIAAGTSDTGDQFQNRCIDLALEMYSLREQAAKTA